MKIGCVIMAAGASERFGRDKLLQPLGGRPLLTHALEALPRERFERIVAVTRSGEVAALCEDAGIRSVTYSGGPQSETVRLGIARMSGLNGCLFLLGDQPLCSRRSLEAMLSEFEAHPDCVIRLSYKGSAGSPVLFPAALFGALAEIEGDRGGMAAARKAGAEMRLVEAGGPQELWDVDTPQTLLAAEEFLAKNEPTA